MAKRAVILVLSSVRYTSTAQFADGRVLHAVCCEVGFGKRVSAIGTRFSGICRFGIGAFFVVSMLIETTVFNAIELSVGVGILYYLHRVIGILLWRVAQVNLGIGQDDLRLIPLPAVTQRRPAGSFTLFLGKHPHRAGV